MSIPTIRDCMENWHHNQQATLQSCQTPNKCLTKGKPTKSKSCQQCIDWGKALEAKYFPPGGSGIQWKNINPTLLYKDPVEAAKGFLFIIPQGQGCTSFDDFDVGGILKLMMGFKEYHGGSQTCHDKIDKVLKIRNGLSHKKIKDNMNVSDQELDDWFNDIVDCVDEMSLSQPLLLVVDIKDCLKKIRHSSATHDIMSRAVILTYGLEAALKEALETQTDELKDFMKTQTNELKDTITQTVVDAMKGEIGKLEPLISGQMASSKSNLSEVTLGLTASTSSTRPGDQKTAALSTIQALSTESVSDPEDLPMPALRKAPTKLKVPTSRTGHRKTIKCCQVQ